MICQSNPEVAEVNYGGKDLLKWYVLTLQWDTEGVMDAESCDDENDLTSEWGGESRQYW